MRQDSKTRHLLPTILITTSLSGLRPDTRITLRKTPLRCPYPFKLYSEACDLRRTRPGAPVLPCTPVGFRQPQQPTARYWFYSFPQPQSMVLHALPSSGHHSISSVRPFPCRPIPARKYCRWIRVEAGISPRSARFQPHQLNYEHAANAVNLLAQVVSPPAQW